MWRAAIGKLGASGVSMPVMSTTEEIQLLRSGSGNIMRTAMDDGWGPDRLSQFLCRSRAAAREMVQEGLQMAHNCEKRLQRVLDSLLLAEPGLKLGARIKMRNGCVVITKLEDGLLNSSNSRTAR